MTPGCFSNLEAMREPTKGPPRRDQPTTDRSYTAYGRAPLEPARAGARLFGPGTHDWWLFCTWVFFAESEVQQRLRSPATHCLPPRSDAPPMRFAKLLPSHAGLGDAHRDRTQVSGPWGPVAQSCDDSLRNPPSVHVLGRTLLDASA